jgi:hypothetical protein
VPNGTIVNLPLNQFLFHTFEAKPCRERFAGLMPALQLSSSDLKPLKTAAV